MALFSERKRLKAIQQQEALGKSFWTQSVPPEARMKIAYAYADVVNEFPPSEAIENRISRYFCSQIGAPPMQIGFEVVGAMDQTDLLMNFIEATFRIVRMGRLDSAWLFGAKVNDIFNSHRIAYKFIPQASQVIELDSFELHSAVVEPAIKLLYGDERMDKAQHAYMDALKQISQHEAGNAITDAGRALQETFKALHVSGKTLGDQIKAARKSHLIPGRDTPMFDAIEKVESWVAAERNENSDAHWDTGAILDDAWLIVHVVGALIVRLAGNPRK